MAPDAQRRERQPGERAAGDDVQRSRAGGRVGRQQRRTSRGARVDVVGRRREPRDRGELRPR
jgi:hypothetical protein